MKQIIEKKIEIIKEAIEIVSEEKLKAFLQGELVACESLLREIEKNGNKKAVLHCQLKIEGDKR